MRPLSRALGLDGFGGVLVAAWLAVQGFVVAIAAVGALRGEHEALIFGTLATFYWSMPASFLVAFAPAGLESNGAAFIACLAALGLAQALAVSALLGRFSRRGDV